MLFSSCSFHRNTNAQIFCTVAVMCVFLFLLAAEALLFQKGENIHTVHQIQRKDSTGFLGLQAQKGYGPDLLGQTQEQAVLVKCHVQACGERGPQALISPTFFLQPQFHVLFFTMKKRQVTLQISDAHSACPLNVTKFISPEICSRKGYDCLMWSLTIRHIYAWHLHNIIFSVIHRIT